jgi:PKD repeat protein
MLTSPTWVLKDATISHLPIYPGSMAFDTSLGESVEFDGLHATTWAYSGGGWTNITPPTSPSPRAYPGLAYDSDSGELVLFGGVAIPSGQRLNDTWVFHDGTWANVTGPTDPPANFLFGFASDPHEGGVLLFGGYSSNASNAASNTTWLFTGTYWRQITNSTATPPPSFEPGMAYDSVDRVIVLFGGTNLLNGNESYSNQTWTYANGNWSNQTVAGPSPRVAPSLSDEVAVGGVLLFGGAGPGVTPNYTNDTWLFHGGRWSRTALTGPSPSPRLAAGLDWDTGGGLAVLDGGDGAHGIYGTEFLPDTWTFQGDTWTEVQTNYTPATRFGEAFTGTLGSPTSAVLFGGLNSTGAPLNDTWTFSRDTWQEHLTEVTPPNRTGSMAANDPPDDYQVMFGGAAPNGTPRNDTWTFDGATWTNRTSGVAPAGRVGGSFLYDPILGTDILFGGRNASNGTLNDTWSFHDGLWTELAPPASPPARVFASAAFDPVLGGIVIFGGSSDGAIPGAGMLNDTWLFANGTWSRLVGGRAPSARYAASMDYDVRTHSLDLFGGWVYPNPPYQLNDTWTYSNAGWRPLMVHAAPPTLGFTEEWWDARSNTTWLHGGAAFDARDSEFVLGGETEALDLLTANASVSGAGGLTPYTVQFNATARNGEAPYQYDWSLAGFNSTAPNGTFVVNIPGNYTAYLNVTDAWGVIWQTTFPVTTTPGPVQATFVATPDEGTAPLTVQFSATAFGGVPPYTYGWNFEDGSTVLATSQTTVNHTFVHNETYHVTLTATASSGGNATITEPIVLQSFALPTTFNVTASVSPASGTVPLNVSFSATASSGTGPYSYAWSFGDGASSKFADGFHVYTGTGRFSIVLNVTDTNHLVVAKTFSVTVVANTSVVGTQPTGPAGSSELGGLPWWAWAVILLLAVAVIVAAVLLVRRGRSGPPPDPATVGPTVVTVRPMPWDESEDSGR